MSRSPRFGVLGPITLHDDAPIPIGRGMRAVMLAWLILHRGCGIAAAESASTLWPHLTGDRADQEVRRHATWIRRRCAPLGVDLTRRAGRLRLHLTGVAVDAELFAAHIRHGEELHQRGHLTDAIAELSLALELWRSSPYPELQATPAGVAEALRLERCHRRARHLHGGLRTLQHGDVTLVADLEARVSERPHDELTWRQLMVALHRSGRSADALRAYQRCNERLADLHQRPAAATRECEHAILTRAEITPALILPQ